MIPCRNSLDHADLMTTYQVHLAPAKEIEKYHGVCKKCFEKFQAKNAGILNGAIERPVEILPEHHAPDPEFDHVGISTDGQFEQTTNFDFAAVEALDADTQDFLDSVDRDALHLAARALELILTWCWSSGFETAQRRFAVITGGLRPSLLDDKSWREIGERLNCSRAALSKASINFQKVFQIKFARSRNESARRHMSVAMQGNENRRKWARRIPTVT